MLEQDEKDNLIELVMSFQKENIELAQQFATAYNIDLYEMIDDDLKHCFKYNNAYYTPKNDFEELLKWCDGLMYNEENYLNLSDFHGKIFPKFLLKYPFNSVRLNRMTHLEFPQGFYNWKDNLELLIVSNSNTISLTENLNTLQKLQQLTIYNLHGISKDFENHNVSTINLHINNYVKDVENVDWTKFKKLRNIVLNTGNCEVNKSVYDLLNIEHMSLNTGSIDENVKQLQKLETLDLSLSSRLKKLPLELMECQNLKTIYFNHNIQTLIPDAFLEKNIEIKYAHSLKHKITDVIKKFGNKIKFTQC